MNLHMFFKTSFIIIFFLIFNIGIAHETALISNYIVAKDGTGSYNTIQSAIDTAASKGGNAAIWIKNGIYRENLSLRSGINLIGATGLGDFGDAEIVGTHTPPLEGHIILRNLKWSGEHSIFYSEEPGTAHIAMLDTCLNVKSGYTFYLPYWNGSEGGAIELFDVNPGDPAQCQDGVICNPYGGVKVFLYNAAIGAGKSYVMQISGEMVMLAASINCPAHFSSCAKFQCDSGIITAGISFSGDATAQISNSRIRNLDDSAIHMDSSEKISLNLCVIDGINNPVIDGHSKGVLALNGCIFPNSSVISPEVHITKKGFLE